MDKLLFEQMLLILKSNVEVYVHGTLEASNSKVKKALKTSLDDTMSMQEDLFNIMTDYNWYQVKNIKCTEIEKTYENLKQNKWTHLFFYSWVCK